MDYAVKYPKLFEKGIGTLNGYKANVTLKPNAVPRFHRPRPVPYALQKKVDNELDRLQQEGILRPVDRSEWASPIVVVRKADGSVSVWRLQGQHQSICGNRTVSDA